MKRFVCTYTQGAVDKFRAARARPWGAVLTFNEDSEEAAHIFFRRLNRNLYDVMLTPVDYSLYEPMQGPESRFGFLSEPTEQEERPGMAAGGR